MMTSDQVLPGEALWLPRGWARRKGSACRRHADDTPAGRGALGRCQAFWLRQSSPLA